MDVGTASNEPIKSKKRNTTHLQVRYNKRIEFRGPLRLSKKQQREEDLQEQVLEEPGSDEKPKRRKSYMEMRCLLCQEYQKGTTWANFDVHEYSADKIDRHFAERVHLKSILLRRRESFCASNAYDPRDRKWIEYQLDDESLEDKSYCYDRKTQALLEDEHIVDKAQVIKKKRKTYKRVKCRICSAIEGSNNIWAEFSPKLVAQTDLNDHELSKDHLEAATRLGKCPFRYVDLTNKN